MSGRIFQNVVLQLKETTDRVIGVIDTEGTVVACSELSGIGKKWPEYVPAINAAEGEDASRLKRFSVVIGSFKNKTNAYSLKERMQNDGYNAVLGENEQGMLRVIVTSFDNKSDAIYSREDIKSKYAPDFQDAWILERKY